MSTSTKDLEYACGDGYVFLSWGTGLSYGERIALADNLLDLHREHPRGKHSRDIKEEAYGGRLTVDRKSFCIGGIAGRYATAELELSPNGRNRRKPRKTYLDLLITRKTNPAFN